jgi:hypothetical protein
MMITIRPEKLAYRPEPDSKLGRLLDQVLDAQKAAYAAGQISAHLNTEIQERSIDLRRQPLQTRNVDPVLRAQVEEPINDLRAQLAHQRVIEQGLIDDMIALRDRFWVEYEGYAKARRAAERAAAEQLGTNRQLVSR